MFADRISSVNKTESLIKLAYKKGGFQKSIERPSFANDKSNLISLKNLPTLRDKILNLKPSVSMNTLRTKDDRTRAASERPIFNQSQLIRYESDYLAPQIKQTNIGLNQNFSTSSIQQHLESNFASNSSLPVFNSIHKPNKNITLNSGRSLH